MNLGQAPWLQLMMLAVIVLLLLTIKRPGSK